MLTNTFDDLKLEFDLIRDTVAEQNGDLKMIDYLSSNVLVTYSRGAHGSIELKGFPWTHVDELKEWLGKSTAIKMKADITIPTAGKSVVIGLSLRKKRDSSYSATLMSDVNPIRSHWIKLAGGVYDYNSDVIRPKVMANPFNLLTSAMVENAHTAQANKYQPFLDHGDIKVELYGNELKTYSYKIDTLFDSIDKQDARGYGPSLHEVLRDVRYGISKHIDYLVMVNIKGLKLINVTFEMHGDEIASFHIARNEEGHWCTTMGSLPHVFKVWPLLSDNKTTYVYPDRHIDHKIKHAPEISGIMQVLKMFSTTINNDYKVCLSAEVIQVLHDTLEEYIADGNIYLKPMVNTMTLHDNIKTRVFKLREKNVMIPGIDKVGDVECYFTYLEDHVNQSIRFEFNSLSQCSFTDSGVSAVANVGFYSMTISLGIDYHDVDLTTLLSSLSVIAAKTVAEMFELNQ